MPKSNPEILQKIEKIKNKFILQTNNHWNSNNHWSNKSASQLFKELMHQRNSSEYEEQRWAHYTEYIFYREPMYAGGILSIQ